MPETAELFYGHPGTPRSNRPIGFGVLALIERDGALLMDLRSDCGRWGLWRSRKVDKALDDALRREVREETGLSVVTHGPLCVASDTSRIVRYRTATRYGCSPSSTRQRWKGSVCSRRERAT